LKLAPCRNGAAPAIRDATPAQAVAATHAAAATKALAAAEAATPSAMCAPSLQM